MEELILQWCWRANGGTTSSNTDGSIYYSTVQANQAAGFSIVTYTGKVLHANYRTWFNFKAPNFVMCKNRDDSDYWAVYHHTGSSWRLLSFNLACHLQ